MDIVKTIIAAATASLVIGIGFLTMTPESKEGTQSFGALAGPDIPSPYLNWGSVRTWNYSTALKQSASTTCSFLSPSASSTLEAAGIKFDTASSSAIIVDIGKSTSAFATTTLIGTTYNIAAGAQAFIQASTSPAAGAVTVFAPNTYLNFKAAGGAIGTDATGFVPVGRCQAQFIEYPTL